MPGQDDRPRRELIIRARDLHDQEIIAKERARIRKALLGLNIYDLTGTSESDLEAG